jgi:SAM-dependent methyltransferase
MYVTRKSTRVRSLRMHISMFVYKWGYRLTIRMGGWWEPLLQAAAPRLGERILEVSVESCRASATLARLYPAVHFFAVQPAKPNESELESLSNLELLRGDQYCINCRAASFDKVICSLALHPLPEDRKLALLKEMRRVLRHGGALYLADFDQPLRPIEIHALRGTGYLFGPETAKPHADGTWLNLIKQAGFVGVRRVTTYSELVGRVAIIRARRA